MAGFARLISVLAAGSAWGETGFHHVHLNATDPAAAVKFYTARFDCEAAVYDGGPAVWAQKSWLLFRKATPAAGADSPIWHIGWGAEDMPAEYKRQQSLGTLFHTPLTDISDLANSPGFYYAYVDGPDHALIELNTARHHNFGHLHLFSADPPAAARWYAKHFGVKPRVSPSPEPRFYKGFQVGPSASFTVGNVNVILFPGKYRGHDRYQSTRGTVFDHIALSVDNLQATLDSLAADGVRPAPGTSIVEGPDKVAIEVIEGPAVKPALRAELPEFPSGDECLFCHRNDIGPGWAKNRHALTVRPVGDQFSLGARKLKTAGYGKFAIQEKDGSWNATKFGERCTGCHNTAVNARTRQFAAYSIDCYACHGVADLDHSNDPARVLLSKKNRPARTVTAICGQCHLRGARSNSTGLPYSANYVPGDDLFSDWLVDFGHPDDTHIFANTREVLENNSAVTCLNCHKVHAGAGSTPRPYTISSPVCEY